MFISIGSKMNLSFILTFSFFCFGCFCTSSTPPILPGLDFVGCGFDLRYERAVDAMRFCLLDMHFTSNKTFIYDNIVERLNFSYPDEVFVRLVETAEGNSKIEF
jgi:hypothetical protein